MATTPEIHPVARAGFGVAADAYERGRPGYPPGAVDALVRELGIGPGRDVVDLAAGTGKLTRALLAAGARVLAVEPVAAMRALLPAGVEVLDGTAESIPLPDASVDVVTVAQAFHWFDRDAALAEIARVLRPDGGLGLVWNERDRTVPWVADLEALFDQGGRPYDKGVDWLTVLGDWGDGVGHEVVGWDQELDEDGLVDRILSTSYVAVLTAARRAAIETEIRSFVAGFPAVIRLPHLTDVYWCRKRS